MACKWEKIETLLDEASELTGKHRENFFRDYTSMSKDYELANQKIEEAYKILTGREYKPKP